MTKAKILHLVCFVCLAAFAGQPTLADRFLGRQVIVVDGRDDPSVPAPLVLAMHGFLGTAANMRKKTEFDALAQRHGFVAVYATGKRRRWNDGRSANNRTDDVGYLSALIKALVADGTVDPRRVFLAGHSNGGGMAMRMACERSDLVRGISVVATKSALNFQCKGGPPVPAIFFHGTRDPISPHRGRSASSRLGGALSSAATVALWRDRNRCKGIGRTQSVNTKDDGTSAQIIQFSGCKAALVHIEITGHGHDWPKPNGRATRLQGPATKELSATALSWRFFDSLF